MAEGKADVLARILRELQEATPEVKACSVSSLDGFIIASLLPPNVNEDAVGALSAALHNVSEKVSGDLGRGSVEQIVIKGDAGYVVSVAIGRSAILTTISPQDATVGLVILRMKKCAEQILSEVGTLATGI